VTRSVGESETLVYAPGGELLYRQVGEKFTFYVGEYATVTAKGAAGCGASCVPQASTVEVDAHVVFAGTRIASVKPSRTLYYYRTRLGTVVATSLGGGVAGAGYRYTPYGEVELTVNESDLTRSELGYTNALRLTGSLLYLKSRVYDAEARVFIQPDTVDRLRYAYVMGDPANLSDPTGLFPDVSVPPGPLRDAMLDSAARQAKRDAEARQALLAAEAKSNEEQTNKEGAKRKKDAIALRNEQEKVEKEVKEEKKRQEALEMAKKQATIVFGTTKRDAAGEVGQLSGDKYGSATLTFWDGKEWHYEGYDARSGSFMANDTYFYNPLNPGEYKADWTSLKNRSQGTPGSNPSMYDEVGFGYSIELKVVNAPGPTQTDLRIHPDGGQTASGTYAANNGTAACIGINTKDSQRFLMDLGLAVSASGNPSIRVVVLP
jgi:RHS repeat-associated protein